MRNLGKKKNGDAEKESEADDKKRSRSLRHGRKEDGWV